MSALTRSELFKITTLSFSLSYWVLVAPQSQVRSVTTYNVVDDARQQGVLHLLVGVFHFVLLLVMFWLYTKQKQVEEESKKNLPEQILHNDHNILYTRASLLLTLLLNSEFSSLLHILDVLSQ